jgi:phosphohistidine phosphatase
MYLYGRERAMPKLILLRHGKSDWTGDEDDALRPLAPRGVRAAQQMGEFLTRIEHVPDAIITSPAERAFQTVRLAMDAGRWSCPVREADALYGGRAGDLIAELRREPPSVRLLLAVGHEPTWSASVAELIGGGNVSMPTAAMACIDLGDTGWHEVVPARGTLLWLLPPRLVANF